MRWRILFTIGVLELILSLFFLAQGAELSNIDLLDDLKLEEIKNQLKELKEKIASVEVKLEKLKNKKESLIVERVELESRLKNVEKILDRLQTRYKNSKEILKKIIFLAASLKLKRDASSFFSQGATAGVVIVVNKFLAGEYRRLFKIVNEYKVKRDELERTMEELQEKLKSVDELYSQIEGIKIKLEGLKKLYTFKLKLVRQSKLQKKEQAVVDRKRKVSQKEKKFICPVEKYEILEKFGKKKLPGGGVYFNDGVYLKPLSGRVIAPIDSDVESVVFVEDIGYVVVLSGGDYEVVLSGLSSVVVKKFSKLMAGELVGFAGSVPLKIVVRYKGRLVDPMELFAK